MSGVFNVFDTAFLQWFVIQYIKPQSYLCLVQTCKQFHDILSKLKHTTKLRERVEEVFPRPLNRYTEPCILCFRPCSYRNKKHNCPLKKIYCIYCDVWFTRTTYKYHDEKQCKRRRKVCEKCGRARLIFEFIRKKKKYHFCNYCGGKK